MTPPQNSSATATAVGGRQGVAGDSTGRWADLRPQSKASYPLIIQMGTGMHGNNCRHCGKAKPGLRGLGRAEEGIGAAEDPVLQSARGTCWEDGLHSESAHCPARPLRPAAELCMEYRCFAHTQLQECTRDCPAAAQSGNLLGSTLCGMQHIPPPGARWGPLIQAPQPGVPQGTSECLPLDTRFLHHHNCHMASSQTKQDLKGSKGISGWTALAQ